MSHKLTVPLFNATLQRYQSERQLSPHDLAVLLQRPVSTVYKWLSGNRTPSAGVVKKLAEDLNWDFAAFQQGLNFERIDQSFLSLDAIILRFKTIHTRDIFSAYNLMVIAGAVAFNYLVNRGFQASFSADQKFNIRISLLDPKLSWLTIVLSAHARMGIRFRIVACDLSSVLKEWAVLNQEQMQRVCRILQAEKDKTK